VSRLILLRVSMFSSSLYHTCVLSSALSLHFCVLLMYSAWYACVLVLPLHLYTIISYSNPSLCNRADCSSPPLLALRAVVLHLLLCWQVYFLNLTVPDMYRILDVQNQGTLPPKNTPRLSSSPVSTSCRILSSRTTTGNAANGHAFTPVDRLACPRPAFAI